MTLRSDQTRHDLVPSDLLARLSPLLSKLYIGEPFIPYPEPSISLWIHIRSRSFYPDIDLSDIHR